MTKGRKPDPTRATRGTGNRPKPGEARPAKAALPVLATPVELSVVDRFPPPESLPDIVHDVWRAAVSDLGGSNHMRESFLPALTAYCEAVWAHAEASANIHKFGVLVKGPNGSPIANPMLRVQKDQAATMLRFADTLGLTPAARVRLGLMEVTGMSLLTSLNQALDGR